MCDATLKGIYLFPSLLLCMYFNLYSSEEVTSCGQLKVIPSIEPLFTRKLDVLEVIEGRNARFDCKVSGTPSAKVTWSHFGRMVLYSVFRIFFRCVKTVTILLFQSSKSPIRTAFTCFREVLQPRIITSMPL